METRILVATRSFGSTSSTPWDLIIESGFEIRTADMTQEITEKRMVELLNGVDGAIIGVVPMTEHVLTSSPRLKVVSMHGVGLDHIDLEAAEKLGVVIANCPGANDPAVADLTIGLMISIARNLPQVDSSLRKGQWGRYYGTELWGKTLGLIGFGRIGHGVARRAKGFSMKVLVNDPYIPDDEIIEAELIPASFEYILENSDFLSLHATLTDETRNLIGREEFGLMRSSAYLINTARGGLVDEEALFDVLNNQQIAGAGIDVFVEEPPINSRLLELENIVLSPHIGAHTRESIDRMGVMAAKNVIQVLLGGEPISRVV